MNPELLLRRTVCDICSTASELQTLVSVPYSTSEIKEVLIKRYEGALDGASLQNADYELLYCSHCKHLFQRYIPSDSLMGIVYTYSRGRIEESFKKRTRAAFSYYEKNARFVEKFAALHPGAPYEISVLDFGMGWGSFLAMAKAFGYPVAGFEVSEERKKFAEDMGIKYYSSFDAMAEKKFYYIHVDQVLEHLAEPTATLQGVSSKLAEKGVMYISVPDCRLTLRDSRAGKINYFRKSIYPLEHINGFTHASLLECARAAGLRPISPFAVAAAFLRQVGLWKNGHMIQAALEYLYRYRTSTSLYFTRI